MLSLGFSSRNRLKKTDDFSSVFNFRKRISGLYLAMHYRPNHTPEARLGLVIGRKTVRQAVQRNLMRRILRELFRHERERMAGLDLVIRVLKGFGRQDRVVVEAEYRHLLERLPNLPQEVHEASPGLAD